MSTAATTDGSAVAVLISTARNLLKLFTHLCKVMVQVLPWSLGYHHLSYNMAVNLTSRLFLHQLFNKQKSPARIWTWKRLEARYCVSYQKQKVHPAVQAAQLGPQWDVHSYMPEATALPNVHTYQDLVQFSLEDPETFWGVLARERLIWVKPHQTVKDCDFTQGRVRWFLGGQLNVSGEWSWDWFALAC